MKKISLIVAALVVGVAVFCSCGKVDEPKKKFGDLSSYITATDENATTDCDSIFKITIDETESKKSEDSSITESSSSSAVIRTTDSSFIGPAMPVPVPDTETLLGPPVIEEMSDEDTTSDSETEENSPSQIEYIVYKPSTHYVHRSTCHWVTSDCYAITDTNGIESRKCSECNPDITIVNEYVEPEVSSTVRPEPNDNPNTGIDSYSRQLLAEITWHEYGTCNVSLYEKARIVAGVMNRVNDSRFPNTVYAVLTQRGQFSGYWPGCVTPSQECYDAVDYYFNNISSFGRENSWWGDGRLNHFYYQ